MAVGLVITVLTCMIVAWVYFSMTGTDESTVTTKVGLNKWYTEKEEARVVDLEEVTIKREVISANGQEEVDSKGYKLIVEHGGKGGETYKTTHYFYDESYQDKEIITRQMKEKTIAVWKSKDGEVYVPYEALNEGRVLEINGVDKTFIYTILIATVLGILSSIFVLFISPLWVIVHLIAIILTVFIPYLLIYLEEEKSVRKRVKYKSVGAVNLYTMQFEGDGIEGIKLLKQTVPMVLMDEENGYLGYSKTRVSVIVDENGDIDIHKASEHRIPEYLRMLLYEYIEEGG